MKKLFLWLIETMLGVLIGIGLIVLIQNQMITEQAEHTKKSLTSSEQTLIKAISLLKGSEDVIDSSNIAYPKEGERYALIYNEKRNFSKDLYFGDSEGILDVSIGQYSGSGIPGEGRPLLLAGHNGTHFYRLREFEKGDFVVIDTNYGKFVYEVYDMKTINKDDFDETQLYDTEEYLMMYTCYPFDSLSTDQRYFVYAKKVSGPTIQEDGSWKK